LTTVGRWSRIDIETILAEDLLFSTGRACMFEIAWDWLARSTRAIKVNRALNLFESSVIIAVETT
jgi:hypothetical protein